MFAISPTDINWFHQLSQETALKEVNFWTPTPWNIKKLKEGDLLLFLLKAPIRKIGGYGVFKYYENLTIKDAWEKFGRGNGVSSLLELIEATGRLQDSDQELSQDREIGCIVLENPVFFDEEEYFSPEEKGLVFPPQIVKIKYFEDMDIINEILKKVSTPKTDVSFKIIKEDHINYRKTTAKDRKGQSLFRQKVLRAYNFKCAISGETCLDVIEAAHIQPYINEESNHVQNGIALRSDIHKLFDAGLITISPDYTVRVNPSLSSEYYSQFDNRPIFVPQDERSRPSKEALEFHNKMVYRNPQ